MTMREAIVEAIKECSGRLQIPTDMIMREETGRRLLREITNQEFLDTELGRFLGLRICSDANLPERFALLRRWPNPEQPYNMLMPVIVGIVDFGPD